MSENDDDWSAQERRALEALAAGPEPGAALAAATVERLAANGILREPRSAWRTGWAAAAAGLILFGLGLALGVGVRRAAAPTGATPTAALPRFVLLLYDAPDEPTLSAEQMEGRVSEYRAWAQSVRAGGRSIAGEKLEPEAARLGPGGPGTPEWPLGGYFVVSAKNLDAAIALARSCPHLRHGGRVEVRAIART